MINIPKSTFVHKRVPKEAFYRHLTLDKRIKDRFVSEIDTIYLENSLTKDRLHLTIDSAVQEILLLTVYLRQQDCSAGILEAIARQNPHKLVFLLCYEGQRQLALYHGRLYRSLWMPEPELSLKAAGFSLEEIWNGFIEQIALYEERAEQTDSLTIDQRLTLQEKIVKLEKQIQKTEAAAWKEIQPKKRFELYSRLTKYKKQLDRLKNGVL